MSTHTIQILLLLTLIALLVAGCASGARSIALPMAKTITARGRSSVLSPRSSAAPELFLVWRPGDYTNFIVFSSFDLKKPVNFWRQDFTQQTNFPIQPSAPQCFYQVRGVNVTTGESAWCVP